MSAIKLSQHTMHNHKPSNTWFYVTALMLVFIYLLFQPEAMSFELAQDMLGAYDSKTAAYFISFAIMLLCALTPLPAELIALANTFIYSPAEAFVVT